MVKYIRICTFDKHNTQNQYFILNKTAGPTGPMMKQAMS
jgi:hypothetical protein